MFFCVSREEESNSIKNKSKEKYCKIGNLDEAKKEMMTIDHIQLNQQSDIYVVHVIHFNTYLRFPTDRVFVELSLLHCIVSEGLEYCDPLVTINIFSIKETSLYISVSAEKQ